MVEYGAWNIIFVNYSDVKTDEAWETIHVLEKIECKTAVFFCDITDEHQVETFIRDAAKAIPAIKDVIQGVMLLRIYCWFISIYISL